MLWRGRNLWHEHVENSDAEQNDDSDVSGKAKNAGKMDSSAKRKWQQFKQKAN